MESTRGDKYCVQHGMFFPSAVIEQGLGPAALANAMKLAAAGRTIGRRCPQDRLAMQSFGNARVTAEACGRCGSVWLPKDQLDAVVATTQAPAGLSPAEARSLLGFAAVKTLLTLPAKGPPHAGAR